MASASVVPHSSVEMPVVPSPFSRFCSSRAAPSYSSSANCVAARWVSSPLAAPTTMREGRRLSYSALPSRRNSGEKTIRWSARRAESFSVQPTGMVDYITIQALSFTARTAAMAASTLEVPKKFFCGS